MIRTSTPYLFPDGVTSGCYVWNSYNKKWIIINVREACEMHPFSSYHMAIRKMAIEIFCAREEIGKNPKL